METNDFVKKLEKILSYYQLSASAFADKIGFQRSSMSHLLSGRNKPSLDFVMKISSTFNEIDINWFLFDQGTFPKSENQMMAISDQELVKSNADLKVQNQKMLQDYQELISKYEEISKQTNLFDEADTDLKVENDLLNDQILTLKKDIESLKSNHLKPDNSDKFLSEINNFKEDIKVLNVDKEQLSLQIKLLQQEKTDLSLKLDKLERLDSQHAELITINKKLQLKIDDLELVNQKNLEKLETFDFQNSQLLNYQYEIALLKKDLLKLNDDNKDLKQQLNANALDLEQQNQTIEDLNKQLHEQSTLIENKSSIDQVVLPPSDVEQVMVLYKNGVFKAYKGQ